jgi:hypothetical protein
LLRGISAICTIFAGTRGDLRQLVGDVDRLAVVVVAIAGDEHLRLDLPDAVEYALHPEIGRARRPHCTDRGRAQLSSSQLSLRLTLSSPRKTTASPDPACLSWFSAKFNRALGKNCAPGILPASRSSGPPPLSPETFVKSHSAD